MRDAFVRFSGHLNGMIVLTYTYLCGSECELFCRLIGLHVWGTENKQHLSAGGGDGDI